MAFVRYEEGWIDQRNSGDELQGQSRNKARKSSQTPHVGRSALPFLPHPRAPLKMLPSRIRLSVRYVNYFLRKTTSCRASKILKII